MGSSCPVEQASGADQPRCVRGAREEALDHRIHLLGRLELVEMTRTDGDSGLQAVRSRRRDRLTATSEDPAHRVIERRRDKAGGGQRQEPGEDDVPGHAPAHG